MRPHRACCAALAVLVLGSAALAGPLASHPDGIPGYVGSAAFNADNLLRVDLDYAVFEPGEYPGAADPSGGTEYVYAYQAFNVSDVQALTTVTIGLLENSGASLTQPDLLFGEPDGIAPTMSSLLETSVITRFLSPQVPAGEYSTVFLYTSPNAPTFMAASVSGGGYSDQNTVPSPIPEPGSLVLVAFGCVFVLSGRVARG